MTFKLRYELIWLLIIISLPFNKGSYLDRSIPTVSVQGTMLTKWRERSHFLLVFLTWTHGFENRPSVSSYIISKQLMDSLHAIISNCLRISFLKELGTLSLCLFLYISSVNWFAYLRSPNLWVLWVFEKVVLRWNSCEWDCLPSFPQWLFKPTLGHGVFYLFSNSFFRVIFR